MGWRSVGDEKDEDSVRVLVDSTVWIDFLRGTSGPAVQRLELLIDDGEDICICGFVLTEVLQGIRDEKQHLATKAQFENLIYLGNDRSTFELAANIFRDLRACPETPIGCDRV